MPCALDAVEKDRRLRGYLKPLEQRLRARIGHRVVFQLGGDIAFDGGARGRAEAAKRVVALKRPRQCLAYAILESALHAIYKQHGGDVRQRAERKLTHVRFAEAMAQKPYAVRFEGSREVCEP